MAGAPIDADTFWKAAALILGCLSWLGTALYLAIQRIARLEGEISKCQCGEHGEPVVRS